MKKPLSQPGKELIKIVFPLWLLFLGTTAGAELAVSSFLTRHCLDCHAGDVTKGGLNLETLSTGLADSEVRRRWTYLYDRVARGEMPPKEKYKASAKIQAAFLDQLSTSLTAADLASREVVLRRLNRDEYENTVRDLFGIFVDLKRILPDDSTEQGFDNNGSDLAISGQQIVTYLEAADLVLDRVFGPETEPRRIQGKWNMKNSRALSDSDPRTDHGANLFSRRRYSMWETSVPSPGYYRFRLQVKAIQTNKPVIVNIWNGGTGEIAPHPAGFFEVKPGQLTTIELTDWSPEKHDNYGIELPHGYTQYKIPKDFEGPGLYVGEIELEGPLREWPPQSLRNLLAGVNPETGTLEDARTILMRILPSAFRRETREGEVNRYVELVKQARGQEASFKTALRRGLKGILCAPEFLYHEESNGVDAYAIATRLSYFLWRSMPDEELFALAGSGDLLEPDMLRKQVERMLRHEKSQRFVESFTGQWLRLNDIDFTVPDRRLYPEYNQLLRRSMLDESHAFFREILDHNLSVQSFIDSDFVMINEPLADFYGIEGVKGLHVRRVDLPDDHPRGGVLTQASVLKVSADGTRTSPVLRGVWILKHLYGTPSPPPPPDAGEIEPDIRGATTIREQLAKHRDHQSCKRCHEKIDPPGFALENFDVLGAHRDWYRVRRGGKWIDRREPNSPGNVQYRQGQDVDASGVMPDGRIFTGIREYKRLLLEDETAMARVLTRLLLSYALGRDTGFSDRAEIEQIVNRTRNTDYGLRSLIHEIVQSKVFHSP